MRFGKLLVMFFAPTLCFAAQADRISGPIDSSQKVVLPGNVQPLAKPEYDQGPVEPSFALSSVTLVMAPSPSQQVALEQLLEQQQDRTSANYHKWLTPEQYADRFGVSQNDINKINIWLETQGMTVLRVARGRNAIILSGTAGQIQSAFNTEIHRYNINGEEHIANAFPISVPSALGGVVTQVRGLTNFRMKPMYVRAPRGSASIHPHYTTTIDGSPDYFIAPGDIATLYDLTPLYDATTPINGTGQKLAIIGQTDVYLADLNDFRSGFGLSTIPTTGTGACTTNSSGVVVAPCDTTNFNYILAGTDYGVSTSDIIEADLDLEWSGAIASGAQIVFVNAPINSDETAGGVDIALAYAIDHTVAPVISMSYGLCEQANESLETELQQANTEGITVMNSAGDVGSFACDYTPPGSTATTEPNPPFEGAQYGLGVSYPASSPEVTGVGGTSIPYPTFYSSTYWSATNNPTNGGSMLPAVIGNEAAWNDDPVFATLCQGEPTNSFCENGGPPAVPGWVALGASATAQQVQEDVWISAGGGGVSNCFTESTEGVCEAGFAKPSWQTVTIPSLTSPQDTYRFVPDVALLASPNFPGYIICTPMDALTGSGTSTASSCAGGIATAVDTNFSLIGGTSAASPVFAGIITLMNQYLKATGGLGNVNPVLYQLAEATGENAFHKITSGNNDVYCQANTPVGQPADVLCPSAGVGGFAATSADATTGYNLVAGLGSVDANALAVAWAAYLDPDFALTASTLAPATVPAGQTASSTLTISAIAGSTGMVVNFAPTGCLGLPAGATCSFSPASVNFNGTDSVTTAVTISTTANMAIPASAQTITIIPANSPGTKATLALTIGATNQSFSLSSTKGATYTVGVGGTASIQLAVTGKNGFVNSSNNTTVLPLTYSCSGIAASAEISCQPQGNAQPTNATSVTVNLVTSPVTSKLESPFGRSRIFYAALLPGIFGLFFLRPRSRGLRMLSLILVLGFSTIWLGSCGGSSNTGSNSLPSGGTPPGNYSVTINATTGGAKPLTGSVTITLSVSSNQ